MVDWFIDPTATGTGSGDSPTNAAVNVNSFMFAANTVSLNYGDRIWFRRHSINCHLAGAAGWGKTAWDNSQLVGWMIGWPRSGQPFYTERPASGTSAGWDVDVQTYVNTDINMTLWVHSDNVTTNGVRDGWGVANIVVNQVAGAGAWRPSSNFNTPKWNVHLLNQLSPGVQNFHDLTLTASNGGLLTNGLVFGGRMTVTASTVVNTALFPTDMCTQIEELVLNSNSIAAFSAQQLNNNTLTGNLITEIVSVRGTKPKEDIATGTNRWTATPWRVFDYFGEGPRQFSGPGYAWNQWVPSSATARVNSRPLMNAASTMAAGANVRGWATRGYADTTQSGADARFLVNVSSGIPLVVRVPLMTLSSLDINPSSMNHPHRLIMIGPNGTTLYTHSIEAGAISSWSGNSVSAGSAWVARFDWTPTFTGSLTADLILGRRQTRQGVLYIGWPLVNSA